MVIIPHPVLPHLKEEIILNNNLLSMNNTVVCETSITCDHIYNKLD